MGHGRGDDLAGRSSGLTGLSFRRTGGFAASALPPVTVELADLSAEDRAAVEAALESLDLPWGPKAAPAPPYPDGFRYVLEIERDGRRERIEVADRDAPPPLRELLGRLTRAASATRRHQF